MQEPDDERHNTTPQLTDNQRTVLAMSGLAMSVVGLVVVSIALVQGLQVVFDGGAAALMHYAFSNSWWILLPFPVVSLIKKKMFGTNERWVLIFSTALIGASAVFALL